MATILFCACLVIAPVSNTLHLKKAEAQGIPVQDIGQTLINTLAQLSTAALEQKELVLDPLFFNIAQQALQQMTNDILKWVNSGFDGEPAFVTDLNDYLKGIADDTAGNFIYGDGLSSLCTPFQLDTRLAVADEYQKAQYGGFKEKAECTLDDKGADTEAFLSGDFSAGGWSVWFEAVLNPLQTPVGAFVGASAELDKEVAAKQSNALRELDWGDGFLSQKICELIGGSSTEEKCTIVKPGKIIAEQTNFALEIPALKMIQADEMDEVIGSLFSNLATQAITGVEGLLGLGGNASFGDNTFGVSGNLSYLDAMAEESANSTTSGTAGGSKIEQALVTETKVLNLQLAIVETVDAAIALFENAFTPYASDSCWKLEIPDKLSDTLDDLTKKVPTTVSTVLALQDLSEKYDAATSAQEQLELLEEFTSMQSNGLISGQAAAVQYDYLLNSDLKKIIDQLKKDITAQVTKCEQ